MESRVDGLVVTYDEIWDTLDSKPINPIDRTNYWLIAVVLLATTCYLFSDELCCEVLHETWI